VLGLHQSLSCAGFDPQQPDLFFRGALVALGVDDDVAPLVVVVVVRGGMGVPMAVASGGVDDSASKGEVVPPSAAP
jgi:hypothetical protein